MENSLFFLYLWGKLERVVRFFYGNEWLGPLSELNNIWLGVHYLGHGTLLLWKIHSEWGSLDCEEKETLQTGPLGKTISSWDCWNKEQRILRVLQEADERFRFQHIWCSVVARELCFLALEKFCSKPGLVWNLINMKQKKGWGEELWLNREVWAPLA